MYELPKNMRQVTPDTLTTASSLMEVEEGAPSDGHGTQRHPEHCLPGLRGRVRPASNPEVTGVHDLFVFQTGVYDL